MSIKEVVSGLADLASPTPITRKNVDQLLDSGQLEIHMKNGNWWECRRNGATRCWKRSPNRIYIPFKYGFKFYGNITEADFDTPLQPSDPEWHTKKLNPLYFRVKPPHDVRK